MIELLAPPATNQILASSTALARLTPGLNTTATDETLARTPTLGRLS